MIIGRGAGDLRTLVDAIEQQAAARGAQLAFAFMKDGEVESGRLTYGELETSSRAVAAQLLQSTRPGERALLIYHNSLDFIAAFLGCLRAGIVAVPVYPPQARREHWERLEHIAADCAAATILSTSRHLASLAEQTRGLPALAACRPIAGEIGCDELPLQAPRIRPRSVAFLQYTSGSTSQPKGVVVTHANLLHNIALMRQAFGHSSRDVLVSWLPLFHDMGLIGNVLQSLVLGARCHIMTPAAFLQQPLRWLRSIAQLRATSSFAPNFAYELCAARGSAQELAGLDLTSWTMALNGAEPVRAETLQRFAAKYRPYGFSASAFYPGYGLAESTLFVSGGGRGAGARYLDVDARALERSGKALVREAGEGTRRLVGCGRAWEGTDIRIVEPRTRAALGEGAVGEIWVRGASVARGYWGKAASTRAAFKARLAQARQDSYLRTGDLGFLHQGELYVTGRLKELIVVRGANYYPQDLEEAVQRAVPGLRSGGGAAFSIEVEGVEELALVQEVERAWLKRVRPGDLLEQMREALYESFMLQPWRLVLIAPASLAKTSSGKIRRLAVKEQLATGQLQVVAQWVRAQTPGEGSVASESEGGEWQRALQAADADALRSLVASLVAPQIPSADEHVLRQPLARFGLDSLRVLQIQRRLEQDCGIAVPVSRFFGRACIEDIVCFLLQEFSGRNVADARPTALPAEPHGEVPLSLQQQQLWLLHAIAPQSAAYNVPACIRGRFEAAPVQATLAELTRRHPILAVRYREDDGRPVQCWSADGTPSLLEVELEERDEAAICERLSDAARRPFDLTDECVWRVTLHHTTTGQYLLFVFHHIAIDWLSLQQLLREFAELYAALAAGMVPAGATRAPSYLQYAVQAHAATGRRPVQDAQFWQLRMGAGSAPVLQLPIDRARPPLPSTAGSSFDFAIGAVLSRALERRAREWDTTLSSLLLTAYRILLARLSNQLQFAIGVPAAARPAGYEGTCGYFVQPLVLTTPIERGETASSLAARTQSELAAALDQQFTATQALLASAPGHQDRSFWPVFQTLFTFYGNGAGGWPPFHADRRAVPVAVSSTAALEFVPLRSPGAQLDLSLLIAESDEGLQARLEYCTELFEAGTVRRYADCFRNLLQAIAADTHIYVMQADLLDPGERHRLLQEFNATAHNYDEARPLPEQFVAAAARYPRHVAVVDENASLTYEQLLSRAQRLARRLQQHGVGPDCIVGMLMERSADMVVAVLAIQLAGGAYLPLDPEHPRERIASIADRAGLKIIVSHGELESLAAQCVHVVLTPEGDLPAERDPPPLVRIEGKSLAYVIYTSGSTGEPKGVMNTHEGILNRILWMQARYQLTPDDRVLQKTPYGFDVSVWEFFWPLTVGATLVCARPGGHQDAQYLQDLLQRRSITTLHFVPSMLQVFLEHAERSPLPSLRRVICSGEELPAALVARFLEQYPDVELHNLYGPTEAAVDVSAWQCEIEPNRQRIPIGRPISNTQLYVLDSDLSPVPIGVQGELYIGGAGLARGYLGRAELTAERFIPHPYATGGERMYRTGDLARYREDGAIEYLGRSDQQVKVRGFRIELGEIEAALCRLAGVREAAVVAQGTAAEKQLIGYVVGEEEVQLRSEELRAQLKRVLPAYMIPAAIARLPSLPLSANGKVDRKALPQVLAGSVVERKYVAARTALEQEVSSGWCEVLGLSQVGVQESFFELGGHSLLAAKLVAQLRSRGLQLTVRDVFEAPTVEEQALRAVAVAVEEEPVLRAVERSEDEPLSYAQRRLWFLSQLEGASATYNMPLAVRLEGRLEAAALRRSLQELVSRHEVLRTVYEYREGEPRQRVLGAERFDLQYEDYSALAPAQRASALAGALEGNSGTAFDLSRELPLRARLLRLGVEDHVLMLCMHHIAADGWSVQVLFAELRAGYQAALSGITSERAGLAVQYIDYVHWQRAWLSGARQERQLVYWREQLQGLVPLLELPTDHARPAVQRYVGASWPVSVPQALRLQLQALAHREQASLFMVLLACFQVLLSKYSGQRDVAVGTPVANRPRSELQGLMGFFVNTLVLRSRVSGGQSFRELLREVRQTTLSAYAHQDLPFEQLVEALQPQRSLSYSPLFQVMLALEHAGAAELSLPGLRGQVLDAAHTVSKFDLLLSLKESEEGLTGSLEYSTDLFERASIERLWGHYEQLLGQVVLDAERPLAQLQLLTPAEQERMLVQWNATAAWCPQDRCLSQLFEEQARRVPQATAVICAGRRTSYAELNEQANRLAHYLRERGVGAEVRVGICLPRTEQMLVALLAVLKAGGAYVPLDPQYPDLRIARILENSAPPVILATQADASRLRQALAGPVEIIDLADAATLRAVRECPAGAPRIAAAAANIAYVIYTSGSTGLPKGVAITHGNAVAMVQWARTQFTADELQLTLASTSIAFDLSVYELFVPLSVGAAVLLVQDALALTAADALPPITLLNTVPSAMDALLAAHAVPPSVRVVNLAGEALARSLVERIYALGNVRAVFNLYGPSEDTTYSTATQVPAHGNAKPLIGRPVSNTQAYVLDEHLQPVAVGVRGELYLAGAGLSRGYLGRPDLTAERYLPNPFAARPGARMYRTGDVVRYLHDGSLDYLGRVDHQIKLRGFRIELGEVEFALRTAPHVTDAACVVRSLGGSEGIVAFVAGVGALPGATEALRRHLLERVPQFMIPAHFELLPQLPTTPNGKVDRAALVMGSVQPGEYLQSDRPQTQTERQLAAIWSELLGREQIRRGDDFFGLGGHSLLAARLNARIADELRVRTSLRDVFMHPKLEQLADVIDSMAWVRSLSIRATAGADPAAELETGTL